MTGYARSATAELSILADVGEIRRASAWLERAGREREVPAEQVARLELCLNEALANVITHCEVSAPTFRISLRLDVSCNGQNREGAVTVADPCPAFDPLRVPARRKPQTLAEAEPGGLGIAMIRGFADDVRYRRYDERNELVFSVRWAVVQ